ncbi:hypothetical protein [Sphingopyxis witflariensis]|uniref:Uncharacterized protein n=1 Tax=Sphingopyxis witflariensis TaxID=173675 RepID=A0A246JYZ0_9SPHN|nr:hypothetical protein [Sphingopyxis witflariensis]OWQ98387.1 hypothetical protein CDQ91_07825 [Sphingopyxis witflariensis]
MPLKTDLELAAITLPLDVVLETIGAAKGKLTPETAALLKVEVSYVLASLTRLENEVVNAIFRDAFE